MNERAIRYDVRKEIEYGFWGTLMVAETATTLSRVHPVYNLGCRRSQRQTAPYSSREL